MRARAAIILAAGKGTRMHSSLPKVLHPVGHRPMVEWTLALTKALGISRTVLVIGTHSEELTRRATALVGAENVAVQDPPLGTAHAVLAARAMLGDFEGDVVVLYADTPLITEASVQASFDALDAGADVAVLGFEARDPGAYGRLIVDAAGELTRIVEAKEATPEQLAVRLCNSGVMAMRSPAMWPRLARVGNANAKQEYYLTDVVELARAEGGRAVAVSCSEEEVQGVNSRVELAEVEGAFQRRRRHAALVSGVTMTDPATVYFAHDTLLGNDVSLEPGVVFGPGVQVASGARIRAYSHLEGCNVASGAVIGPFARLRPGAEIGAGALIGNFVEVKNVTVGAGAKANHLAYLGDGEVGDGANIGAGTIFCNYDGFDKYRTVIEAGAFVGSNSSLVAPVTIGAGAYIGSGSVVTKNVPGDSLAVARGRQTDIAGWARVFRDRKKAEKAARTKKP
jgi:bifunctional UDP-N-acetylglucosamine pyrophosphorylase/glucosamine-1-phosphate N-acetyltransferase